MGEPESSTATPDLQTEINLADRRVRYEWAAAQIARAMNAEGLRRIPRNKACPCGSGRKFKRCCLPVIERGPNAQQ